MICLTGLGGAKVIGRNDIGEIAVGKAGDLFNEYIRLNVWIINI